MEHAWSLHRGLLRSLPQSGRRHGSIPCRLFERDIPVLHRPTTVLQAASLFDIPPINDDVLVGTATTDVHTAQNRSAFITAIDQIDIVDPVSVLIITRAETSSEAESTGTPIGSTSAVITPAELVAIQQALVPVETGAPLVTSTSVKASEQPQESTTGTMD
ncbi:hypothetical protein MTO96_049480 [Rhipicephalus appendiculatus]